VACTALGTSFITIAEGGTGGGANPVGCGCRVLGGGVGVSLHEAIAAGISSAKSEPTTQLDLFIR
jgi:hypothetical protein